MRQASTIGARGLSVAWSRVDGTAVITVRGTVGTDNLEVLLVAIDDALGTQPASLVLDGDQVQSWSARGLEVLVHSSIKAAELRVGFAASGLGSPQLERIRRTCPGVPIQQFGHSSAMDAINALMVTANLS